jgi:hypothetical protein
MLKEAPRLNFFLYSANPPRTVSEYEYLREFEAEFEQYFRVRISGLCGIDSYKKPEVENLYSMEGFPLTHSSGKLMINPDFLNREQQHLLMQLQNL